MKISVKVVPYSKKEMVQEVSKENYIVRVNAIPSDGEANDRVVELLSKHFDVPKSKILLLRGHKSRNKVFELAL